VGQPLRMAGHAGLRQARVAGTGVSQQKIMTPVAGGGKAAVDLAGVDEITNVVLVMIQSKGLEGIDPAEVRRAVAAALSDVA